MGISHSWLKHLNCWWKALQNLICYSCIFHVQHVHLKKWTLKFKLLYLRNYISYLNKIFRICWMNICIQSLNVWRKFVLPWLKYSIFARGLFLLAHPSVGEAPLKGMTEKLEGPHVSGCRIPSLPLSLPFRWRHYLSHHVAFTLFCIHSPTILMCLSWITCRAQIHLVSKFSKVGRDASHESLGMVASRYRRSVLDQTLQNCCRAAKPIATPLLYDGRHRSACG